MAGAAIGAASYGASYLGGYVTQNYGAFAGVPTEAAAHGAIAGAQGGNFWTGFKTAAVAGLFTPLTDRLRSAPQRYAMSAVIGGTTSVVGYGCWTPTFGLGTRVSSQQSIRCRYVWGIVYASGWGISP